MILATVASGKAMTPLIDGLGTDGKLLVVGASPEPIEVTPIQLIGQRRSVSGWPSGRAADSEDTLRFSVLTGVRPMIEIFPLEKAADARGCPLSRRAGALTPGRHSAGAGWPLGCAFGLAANFRTTT